MKKRTNYIERIAARSYYGRHSVDRVLLVNGRPMLHLAGPDAKSEIEGAVRRLSNSSSVVDLDQVIDPAPGLS